MNFNFNSKAEYTLQTGLIEEMINLYGIAIKFIVTEKINKDDNVFGDYSHLKSDSEKIYTFMALPETSEDWESGGYNFSQFGLVNLENIVMFCAKSNFEELDHDEFSEIVGNLIVLPNNKIMEITDVDATVPGINNLFTYNDAKSVYKLTCKPYDFKLISELPAEDITAEDGVPYTTLDTYFQELIDENIAQDTEAEVTPQVDTVDDSEDINQIVQEPIVDKDEKSIWGQFD